MATQVGMQRRSNPNFDRVSEMVLDGAVGTLEHVHVWGSRSHDKTAYLPAEGEPPEWLHYDLWIGPAPYRPYHEAYLPAKWRGWWDFGGGTLADMACHHMDLPFWALDLRVPRTIALFLRPTSTPSCHNGIPSPSKSSS